MKNTNKITHLSKDLIQIHQRIKGFTDKQKPRVQMPHVKGASLDNKKEKATTSDLSKTEKAHSKGKHTEGRKSPNTKLVGRLNDKVVK